MANPTEEAASVDPVNQLTIPPPQTAIHLGKRAYSLPS